MRIATDLPYATRVIEDWIPLSDGTRLWARFWMPETTDPVPAILEYLPYRHGDWTAPRDAERHPFYAGHGYASIRVDIRGHGSSDGVPGDEYDAQELADGVEVIQWIAAQDWCTGSVGMFGISWGGFNALQLAALQPEPLKAIVTTCSTDDRYDNDVHYVGGSVLGVDMMAWAATMLTFESRPPDIRARGDQWREQWLHRLERMDPFLDTWLSHQRRDDYWRHGSVCENYDAIDAAVMTVGGWYDPYRDTVLRLVENLSARGKTVRGLLGPWAHQYPDRDLRPGPHIDFLGETLRWFDHHLKGADNGALDVPLLRTWITDSVRPSSVYEEMPGSWIAEDAWPSPQVGTRVIGLDEAHLPPSATAGTAAQDGVLVRSPQDVGGDAGRYFPYGNAADLPTDQRADDARSVCFDVVLEQDLEVLGNARLFLRVLSPTPRGQVYVRLTDVAADGSSTLVTRGNLNLSSRKGRDRAIPMPVGEWTDIEMALTGIGYRFPAGHVLRIAISSAYWPWVWPQPGGEGFRLDPSASRVELPVRAPLAEGSPGAIRDASIVFENPVQAPPLEVVYPDEGRAGAQRPERLQQRDVVARETLLQVDPAYGGTRVYPDGLVYNEDTVERYWITWDDPLSARAESEWTVEMSRPDADWHTSVRTFTQIVCDAEKFHTVSRVECRDGEEIIFEREWRSSLPREAG